MNVPSRCGDGSGLRRGWPGWSSNRSWLVGVRYSTGWKSAIVRRQRERELSGTGQQLASSSAGTNCRFRASLLHMEAKAAAARRRTWHSWRAFPVSMGLVGAVLMLGGAAAEGARVVSAAALPSYSVLVGDGQSGAVYVLQTGLTNPTTIPAPVPGGVEGLTISPDGSQVYVDFASGAIAVIDTATDRYKGTSIELGSGVDPGPMVVTPNGQDLSVAEAPAGQVVEVDLLTGQVMAPAIATGAVDNLAISPDGSSLYFDGGIQGTSVGVIDTATNTVAGPPIPVSAPGTLIPSTDGSHLYVLTAPPTGPALAVIDLASNASQSSLTNSAPQSSLIALPATAQLSGMALDAGTGELYLPDASLEQLQTIDPTTTTVAAAPGTLAAGFIPGEIGVTPDGTAAYLEGTNAAGEGEVLSMDLLDQTPSAPILLGSGVQPAGLVIAPAPPSTTPTPAPTPSPICSPLTGIGPVVVGPAVLPSGAASGSAPGSSDSAPNSTPTRQPLPMPTTTASPQVTPSPSASASVTPSTGPIVCFGAATVAPGPHPAAALASNSAASPTGGLLLSAGLALLGIVGGGAALFARRSGWTMPDLRTWKGR